MNKGQLVKEFSELYVGKNPMELAENHVKKKRKEMLLLIAGGLFLVVLSFAWDRGNYTLENTGIQRNKIEEGKEEITLQMKYEGGTWENVFLELHPKEYSQEELEELFEDICEVLPETILNENESMDDIHSDLNLVQEIGGYPFFITWESSNPDVLDEQGKLTDSFEHIEQTIELTAVLQYEDWEKEHILRVHVITQGSQDFTAALEKELKQREQTTRQWEIFELPRSFQKKGLQWRYVPTNSALAVAILFAAAIPFISHEKDREIHKQVRQRKEILQEAFPAFISKLILLLEAGMSIRGAFFQIVEDERSKGDKKKSYLYMELLHVCRQMKNGLSEKEAYELLGKRCNLSCYKKLSGILVQHLQKGGSNVLETLRAEALKAGEEQRRQIQKKGEEMETKLLFPMMIMLGIVMVFIMVPALFSFQM